LFTLILTLVRHGETAWNAQSRLQGQTDISLSDTGRAQAQQLGRYWAVSDGPPRFTACYASDLGRAQETAQIVLGALPAPVPTLQSDTNLRERNFGIWEGLTPHERAVKFGEVDTRDCPEGGEFWEDVWVRMLVCQEILWERHAALGVDSPNILVVGHGGSLRCWLANAEGADATQLRRYILPNTSVSVITLRGESFAEATKQVIRRADTNHLKLTQAT
jgi:2,3-bisphosphoglycerate-dependent phosphoglycerate mutase